MNALTIMHLSLSISCIFSICCRLNLMGKDTKKSVSFVYVTLGTAIARSLMVPTDICILAALTFAAIVLAMDAHEWKHKQPNYTIDPNKRRLFT